MAISLMLAIVLLRGLGMADLKAMDPAIEAVNHCRKISSGREDSSVILVRNPDHVRFVIFVPSKVVLTGGNRQSNVRTGLTGYLGLGQPVSNVPHEEEASKD